MAVAINSAAMEHAENVAPFASIDFEDPTLEPKGTDFESTNPSVIFVVQVPYQTRPGQVPRRIQVERLKRTYRKRGIEDLLAERGILFEVGKEPR